MSVILPPAVSPAVTGAATAAPAAGITAQEASDPAVAQAIWNLLTGETARREAETEAYLSQPIAQPATPRLDPAAYAEALRSVQESRISGGVIAPDADEREKTRREMERLSRPGGFAPAPELPSTPGFEPPTIDTAPTSLPAAEQLKGLPGFKPVEQSPEDSIMNILYPAEPEQVKKYEELEKEGATPREIFAQHKAQKDPEGVWWEEIDPRGLKTKPREDWSIGNRMIVERANALLETGQNDLGRYFASVNDPDVEDSANISKAYGSTPEEASSRAIDQYTRAHPMWDMNFTNYQEGVDWLDTNVSNVFSYPGVFGPGGRFPELADVRLTSTPRRPSKNQGVYGAGSNVVGFFRPATDGMPAQIVTMSQGKQGTWRPERGTFGHEIQHATSEQNPALSYGFTSDEKTTMDMFENYLIPEYERIKKKGGEPRYPEQLQDVTKALRAVQEYGNDQVLYYLNPDEGRARNQEYRGSLPAKADIGLPFTDPYVPGGITGNRAEVASPENWLADRLYLDYWKHADERGNTSDPKVAGSEKGVVLQDVFATDHGPDAQWLKSKQEAVKAKGRDEYGVPNMSSITGYFRGQKQPVVSVEELAKLKGARGEQANPRKKDLEWIKKDMQENGLANMGAPFITVGYDGVPWVSEGNHRIMAAKELGIETLPVEIRYFDGGEMAAKGAFAPEELAKTLQEPVELNFANGGEVTKFIRKRAEGSPPEGEEVDPESVGEARDMPTLPPAVKMYLGDILFGWGENRGMLEEDLSQEQRDWFINRALEAKALEEQRTGQPVTELKFSKWDQPESSDQIGGFFSQDPDYQNKFSPAYQLRNYLGDTNVSFLPDGSIVTRNETYDFSPEYDKKSLTEWIKDQGFMGALGKLGAKYGTREDTGKAVKRDIKWR